MSVDEAALVDAARRAFELAYAPYSHFRVGAAVATDTGEVFAGCNVENASYGGTICAERNAIGAAVAAGARAIRTVVVFTDHTHPASPCGICRQVIREFGADADVISVTADGQRKAWTLRELLPDAFGPEDLGR